MCESLSTCRRRPGYIIGLGDGDGQLAEAAQDVVDRANLLFEAEPSDPSGQSAKDRGRLQLCNRPTWSAAADADTATDQIPCVRRIRSAACSPITTQVAMVFPVVMRGMIEASAMRRQSMP